MAWGEFHFIETITKNGKIVSHAEGHKKLVNGQWVDIAKEPPRKKVVSRVVKKLPPPKNK